MSYRKFYFLTIMIASMALFPLVTFAHLPQGIAVSIEPVKATYGATDKLEVEVTYENITSLPIQFLTIDTALEGQIGHDFFSVTLEAQAVPYIGMHIKRLPPSSSDYIELLPNQKESAIVDLGGSYAMESKGVYSVTHLGEHFSFSSGARKQLAATLNLVEDKPIYFVKQVPIIDSSCTQTQRAQIDEALTIAERIALGAARDLNNAPEDQRATAPRYLEWFGAYTPARYDSVTRGMNLISRALTNNRIGFDCTCNIQGRENVFAFVFTNDPFNMNVCPVFFRVAASGTDSRSGTIVHEISHFNVVAATDDFNSALNQAGSRRLALSSPNSAILNANAFEYFAENTPFLSMPAAVVGGGSSEPDPEPEPEPELEPPVISPILPLLLDD